VRKRVTSSDVAKMAGVSRSLVSAFLNGTPGITVSEENRAAIMNAIKELNYTVNVQAKGIKTGRSHCIAVYGDVYNALFLQMVEGIQSVSGPAGYHVLLYGEGRNMDGREGLISLYRQGRIDGIITLDFPDPLDPSWEKAVLDTGVPYVTVEGIPVGGDIHSVQTDYRESVRMALDFLWENTGIAPVYVNVLTKDRAITRGDRLRNKAYLDWMEKKKLEPVIKETVDEAWNAGMDWWRKWMEEVPKPASILSNWSRGAVSVYRMAHEMNWRIGRDFHVMAADNTERVSRHMIPALPCVEVPYVEMGAQAFRLLEDLMRQLDGQDTVPAKKEIIACKLYRGLDD
jgi:LacI family transcriptional regulator